MTSQPSPGRAGRMLRALPVLALAAATLVPSTAHAEGATDTDAGAASAAGQCTTMVTSSSVTWGIKTSWRNYIGSGITLADGASRTSDGLFSFPGTSASDGTVSTSGSLHASAHGGMLDLGFSKLTATVKADGTGSLKADYTSKQMSGETATGTQGTLAEFTGATPITLTDAESHTAGTYTKTATATSTTLAADGVTLLDGGMGFYTLGTVIDNPTISVTYKVDCATPEPEQPATPSPKVTLSATELDPAVDNTITVTGTGFTGTQTGVYVSAAKMEAWKPGENPASLGRDAWIGTQWVRADSITDGSFTTTVTIPANTMKAGEKWNIVTFAAHRESVTNRSLDTATALTLKAASTGSGEGTGSGDGTGTSQGSGNGNTDTGNGNNTGQPGQTSGEGQTTGSGQAASSGEGSGSAKAAASDELTCKASGYTISSGSLEWGFKSSFRAYVTGTIAKGSIQETGFTAVGGVANPSSKTATINYRGSMHFTGHDGKLDLTIANPVLHVTSANAGYLTASVSSTDMNGKATNYGSIKVADVAFSTVSFNGNKVSISSSSVTLAASAVDAFAGFYKAGQALDNLSSTVTLSEETTCYDAEGNVVSGAGGLAKTGADPLPLSIASAGLLTAGLLIVGRRRTLTKA